MRICLTLIPGIQAFAASVADFFSRLLWFGDALMEKLNPAGLRFYCLPTYFLAGVGGSLLKYAKVQNS